MYLITIVQRNRGQSIKGKSIKFIKRLLNIITNMNNETPIEEFIRYPHYSLNGYLKKNREEQYDFLPEYLAFNKVIYYELMNSLNEYQLKNFYIEFYIQWKRYIEENKESKYKDKVVLSVSQINLKYINDILKKFISNDKILGIVIINLLQKQVLG